jgi:hypothetical protein
MRQKMEEAARGKRVLLMSKVFLVRGKLHWASRLQHLPQIDVEPTLAEPLSCFKEVNFSERESYLFFSFVLCVMRKSWKKVVACEGYHEAEV